MTVETEADKKIEEAKESVKNAIRCLSDICINECWGHDEYTDEYSAKIKDATFDLLKIKKNLNC